jgi:ferredoxin
MKNTKNLNNHPDHIKLAEIFSSVKVMGPPFNQQLIDLISHIFNQKEASLGKHLSFIHLKTVEQIAGSSGNQPEEISPILNHMSQKRIIHNHKGRFMLFPLIPGMFEYVFMTGEDSEWHRIFSELLSDLFRTSYISEYLTRPINVVRNIPVQHQIENKNYVADSDLISELVDSHSKFAVLNACPCRHSMAITGHKCKRALPEDGCLLFGEYTSGSVETGSARAVSKREMIEIVEERWEKNLVFFTSNVTPRSQNTICTCCDCCCHGLEVFNDYSKNFIAASHFVAEVNELLCDNCGKCKKVCNTNAHTIEKKIHIFTAENCIGCSNCVEICDKNAISMKENLLYNPPSKGFTSLLLKALPPVVLMGTKIKLSRFLKHKKG